MQLAPPAWSPGAVAPAASTRPGGLLRGGFAAWRGEPELAVGAPLTALQVSTLADFLAPRAGLDVARVRLDLGRVRVLVGGLAAGAGNTATTVGTNIYVSDAARATRMLSWAGRGWLAHELVHTLQWRRTDPRNTRTDAARDRAFLDTYLGAYLAHDGRAFAGGLARALAEGWHRWRRSDPIGSVGELFHDSHPLEVEAIRLGREFVAATAATAGARSGRG